MAYPTPYPEVNAVVDDFFFRAKSVLSNDFVGMYLCGSVALGDFTHNRSDVDVVIITSATLSDEKFAALTEMHTQFAGSGLPLAKVLEGSYVPLNDLREYDPAKASYPRIDCGQTLQVEHSSWWVIERHVLREHGIVWQDRLLTR